MSANDNTRMKPFKEILRSQVFMREVSILFIGLAALSIVFSLLLFTGSNGAPQGIVPGFSISAAGDHLHGVGILDPARFGQGSLGGGNPLHR